MERKRKVVIVGCARSGIGAAKLANLKGDDVVIFDQKPFLKFNEAMQQTIAQLKAMGIRFQLAEEIDLREYACIVMSPGVPLDIPCIQQALDSGANVMGELEFAYGYCKSPVVAITGTNGKTTTTALVGEIMKAYNNHTYVVGNIGRAFSEDVLAIPSDGITVAEVSSFQLETTKTFHPKVAAILNITPDHLNRHKTMANYCEAKYQVTVRQTEEDLLVLNGNDPYYNEALRKTKAKVATFDSEKKVGYGTYVEDDCLYENMSGSPQKVCCITELKILGKHNIENALAAIAICKGMAIPTAVIREGLINFKGVEHRIEYVTTKKGIDFYNDSKATNVGAAIPGLVSMHKPIRLIAGGLDKGVYFDEWIKLFHGRVKKVYVIGETRAQIIAECKESGFTAIEPFETFEDAIYSAYGDASEGECILLSPACASWDMFESYEQRGDLFKQIVNNLEE